MAFDTSLVMGFVFGGVFLCAGWWVINSIIQEHRRDRVPVLLYHHFAAKQQLRQNQDGLYHPAYFSYDTAFEEQMKFLHEHGYTTISLDDFLAFQDGKKNLPSKPVIITFDDGFMSNYLYAFPVLKKYRMTATLFVTVDPSSENFKKYAAVDAPLTTEQMKEMSDYGISIGSHSMTHRYLSALDRAEARWELEESKRRLEDTLQKPVRFFAVPSGAYSRGVKQLVKETGYRAAFCMLKGTNNPRSNPYALRRLVIGRDFSLADFQRILRPTAGCYLRLAGSIQNALLFLLGPGGIDAVRDTLYGWGFGSLVTRGQVRYLVPSVAAAFFLTLLAGLLIVMRAYFQA